MPRYLDIHAHDMKDRSLSPGSSLYQHLLSISPEKNFLHQIAYASPSYHRHRHRHRRCCSGLHPATEYCLKLPCTFSLKPNPTMSRRPCVPAIYTSSVAAFCCKHASSWLVMLSNSAWHISRSSCKLLVSSSSSCHFSNCSSASSMLAARFCMSMYT